MKGSKLLAEIKAMLLSRRSALKDHLSGSLDCLGTDDDEESLGDEAYFGMAVSESKALHLVQAALERFQAETYGICESCACEIPGRRLKTLPCTTFCIDCQRDFEGAAKGKPDDQLVDRESTR